MMTKDILRKKITIGIYLEKTLTFTITNIHIYINVYIYDIIEDYVF